VGRFYDAAVKGKRMLVCGGCAAGVVAAQLAWVLHLDIHLDTGLVLLVVPVP
jgi:hypothetical protein